VGLRAAWSFAIILGFVACGDRRVCVAPRPIHTLDSDEIVRRRELVDAFSRNRVRTIELDALGCFGSCPRYVARFFADGHATFHDTRPECDEQASAHIVFDRIAEAARIGGAEALLPKYNFATQDVFAARIMIVTATKTYVSEGPDRMQWGPEFLATFTRLDQIVRDTTWTPSISLENCAIAPIRRL
jgi:hypothetical protein